MDIGKLAQDAAAGAAAGSIVPGIGTALGAVGGVALDLAPELGKWLFGANAAPTIAAVQSAVARVTGTTSPAEQVAELADPDLANDLRVQLAQIAADRETAADQADADRFAARLADVANAREQTLALATAGSSISWGAPVVSLVVMVTFAVVTGFVLLRPIPAESATVITVLLTTLQTLAVAVVSYWVGSSAGSAEKTRLLAVARPTPAPANADRLTG